MEVCAFLRDVPRAATLYRLLLPYAQRSIVAGGYIACFGSAARYLGLLAAFNLRLPSKPRVYASSTIMDSQCFPHIRGHRHVF